MQLDETPRRAFKAGDLVLVRRVTALLGIARGEPVTAVAADEFIWRATKRQATHNRYFPEFAALMGSVEAPLADFAAHTKRVKALVGCYLDHMAETTDAALPAAA